MLDPKRLRQDLDGVAEGLARRGFHVVKIALYFGVAIAAVLAADLSMGVPPAAALRSAAWLLLPMGLAVGLLAGLAWLYARLTVYTITSGRVVIRSGLALPTHINLPFDRIQSAGLKTFRDGTGEIALRLERGQRASLAMLWPHVRPFHWARPEPALRCVAPAEEVAGILSGALAARDQGSPAAEASHQPQPGAVQDDDAASRDAAMA